MALFSIAIGIRKPIKVDKATSKKSRPSVARVIVEMDVSKPSRQAYELLGQFATPKIDQFKNVTHVFIPRPDKKMDWLGPSTEIWSKPKLSFRFVMAMHGWWSLAVVRRDRGGGA
ncbi:Uncharacterized protein Fot_00694 [Forsythia ovata]|uniref:Uncharacterized protein n=1 Tax=Forsythia ovata TaxID=205694 RepID=A0ABD1X2Q0_9LAMI